MRWCLAGVVGQATRLFAPTSLSGCTVHRVGMPGPSGGSLLFVTRETGRRQAPSTLTQVTLFTAAYSKCMPVCVIIHVVQRGNFSKHFLCAQIFRTLLYVEQIVFEGSQRWRCLMIRHGLAGKVGRITQNLRLVFLL